MGEQLKDLANGIDESDIQNKYVPQNTSLSCGQTLIRGYFPEEALLLLREMNDDLSGRLRAQNSLAGKVSLYVGYENGMSYGKSWTLPYKTDDTDTLYEAIEDMFLAGADNIKIRGLNISYGSLGEGDYVQLWTASSFSGKPTLESYIIDAEKGLVWDDSDIASGILRVKYDPATAISEMQNDDSRMKNSAIYDLQGRRISTMSDGQQQRLPRGIYIQNGRKFIVK